MKSVINCTVVDVFAGIGGLTHGFILEGFNVVAGIDADNKCKYPYEKNNPGAKFVHRKIEDISPDEILGFYPNEHLKILVGCAPCQPFSAYTRKKGKHEGWRLLYDFGELIEAVHPEIVSIENVPRLSTFDNGKVYDDFISRLESNGYTVSAYPRVYGPDYGVPQHRYRLILFASKFGQVSLMSPTHTPNCYRTVRAAIGALEHIRAGEASPSDPIHRASILSETNVKRIRASIPGGTWESWEDILIADCHKKPNGKWYRNVYGRMSWDEPAPTITTQCYGFGNGRFGHPEQDRAISLREAALLQTFPPYYEFINPAKPWYVKDVARWIGNAVPVVLARVIAKSIRLHIFYHRGESNKTRKSK